MKCPSSKFTIAELGLVLLGLFVVTPFLIVKRFWLPLLLLTIIAILILR